MHLSDIKTCSFCVILRTVVEFPRNMYAISFYSVIPAAEASWVDSLFTTELCIRSNL